MKVSIKDIKDNNIALSSLMYSNTIIPSNIKQRSLSDFFDFYNSIKNGKGIEIGSERYAPFYANKAIPFIRISDINSNSYIFSESRDTQLVWPLEKSRLLKNGDVVLQTASNNLGKLTVYYGNKALYNSHIRIVGNVNDKYMYYILAFFNSSVGLNQYTSNGSIKGIDNFSNNVLKNINVPFQNKDSTEYISNISKKILMLELSMRDSLKKINHIFNEILDVNGNDLLKTKRNTTKTNIKDLYDSSWNFRQNTKTFKDVIKLIKIKSYKEKPYFIDSSKLISGNTPKTRFKDVDKYDTVWITPTNFSDFGFINKKMTIVSPNLKTINSPSLLIVNRTSRGNGEYVGIAGYWNGKIPGHFNQGVYSYSSDKSEQLIYLTALINSDIYRYIFQSIGRGSKMREIRSEDISKIPFFEGDETLKKKIVNLMTNNDNTGYLDQAEEKEKLLHIIDKFFSDLITI